MTKKTTKEEPPGANATSAPGTPPKLPVVAIGASAGGLEAFKVFFDKMPADTGMVFVLIPHLDPDHKSLMVEIIGRRTAMPAVQVEGRMTIAPNHVYIVPPNRNLAIEGDQLVPCEISRTRGINLPVDHFFRSLAETQEERAIGVILSGTMRDGAMGLKDIKEHGGLVIAQSPETAQHDGMPQSAIDTGMVDFVLPVEDMPDVIVKFISHSTFIDESRVEDQDEVNKMLAAEETMVRQLESELTDIREDLQNTIEELETSNEELKASNEEMMSMNEELNTVNSELREKVEEIEAAGNDMANLMNSTDVATVFLDIDMKIRRFTPSARRLFNLISSDVGRPIGDLVMRFSDDKLQSHAARVLDTLEPLVREVETDEGRWYTRRVLPFRTQDDRMDGLVLTFSDVTDLKKSETRITRQNSHMKLAQEITRLGYWTFDITTGQAEWSDMMFDIFGRDPAAGVPKYEDHRDFIHPDDWDAFDQSVQGAIAGTPYQVELRVVFPDGGIRHVMSHGYPQPDADGNTAALFGVTQDITERRLAESKARRHTNILRQAERIADMGSWEWEIDQDIVHWSDGLFRIFKRDPAQGAPKWAEQPDFYAAEDFERFRQIVEECVRTGEPYEAELRAIRSDGEIRHCVVRGEAERGPDGKVRRLFGILKDVTERKRVEQRLEASRIDLELAQRIAHVGNWALDPVVGVPAWSDEIYRIYERDSALGPPSVEDYKKMYAPDQYEIFHCAIQSAIREGTPYDIHLHLTLPGGKTKWLHAVCRPDPKPSPAGHFLRGTIQDITEIKDAEEQLQAYSHRLEDMVAERTRELEAAQKELLLKERLAVLGHFSGSISHELRNPLAAIDSAAYLLDMKYGETDEKTKTWTDSIKNNVTHAAEIITSLLSLTRMKVPETMPAGLDALIDDALSATRIPAAVETVLDLPAPSPVVQIDPNQLRMVLKNLLQNAVQAMAENGRIVISARPARAGLVEILVSDTGPGLPPEDVEMIFDPLFSTKTHGIGFGLSIVKLIVENHGGAVRAASDIGGGAAFVLNLPT